MSKIAMNMPKTMKKKATRCRTDTFCVGACGATIGWAGAWGIVAVTDKLVAALIARIYRYADRLAGAQLQ